MLTRILLAAAMLAVPLSGASAAKRAPTRAPAPPPSVAQFDGNWSVSIVTDSGACDRGYRYAVHIRDGQIYYDNPSFSVSGQVTPRGYVSVTVGARSQQGGGPRREVLGFGRGPPGGPGT